MIFKNGKIVLLIPKYVQESINGSVQGTVKLIGAVYKGAQLIWLSIYSAVKSCYGSGTWLGDKLWLSDDIWKSN